MRKILYLDWGSSIASVTSLFSHVSDMKRRSRCCVLMRWWRSGILFLMLRAFINAARHVMFERDGGCHSESPVPRTASIGSLLLFVVCSTLLFSPEDVVCGGGLTESCLEVPRLSLVEELEPSVSNELGGFTRAHDTRFCARCCTRALYAVSASALVKCLLK